MDTASSTNKTIIKSPSINFKINKESMTSKRRNSKKNE